MSSRGIDHISIEKQLVVKVLVVFFMEIIDYLIQIRLVPGDSSSQVYQIPKNNGATP
jgi:hypothetical protein